ncbi:hypothetical protein Tco_0820786 [Tanacetum coccineum]|uniref:Uncharacterized protein n=1 Tax=Tanacetum coccineum TaxID=301880 RepID=A0ABQ5ADD2_9ASTR
MVTGVPGQEGAEGYVTKKKKVKESMEANLHKLLKYNALSTSNCPTINYRNDLIMMNGASGSGGGDGQFQGVFGGGVDSDIDVNDAKPRLPILDINALALSDRHPTYHETPSDRVKMDDPNITMEEYIRLEEEKSRRRAIVLNDSLTSNETPSCEPTVSSLNGEIDFRISFDESDDEDHTVVFDKNSFSYKIFSTNDLKTDSENDNEKVNKPLFPSPEPTVSCFDGLAFFKDFENEFPAIVYNDALTSKSDFLTEHTISPQHIDEFNLKDETSLSECDEEEQNVLYFNDLFSFNVIYPDDSKSDEDNDDDKIDIEHSSGNFSIKPLPDLINTIVGAYAHGPNKFLETSENQESASSASKDKTAASSKRGWKSERDDRIRFFLVELGLYCVDAGEKHRILENLPFKVEKLLAKYHGIPLLTKKIGIKDCKVLVVKVKKKVNDWKNKRFHMLGGGNLLHLCWQTYWALETDIT